MVRGPNTKLYGFLFQTFYLVFTEFILHLMAFYPTFLRFEDVLPGFT